jgi:hypothetical protein
MSEKMIGRILIVLGAILGTLGYPLWLVLGTVLPGFLWLEGEA